MDWLNTGNWDCAPVAQCNDTTDTTLFIGFLACPMAVELQIRGIDVGWPPLEVAPGRCPTILLDNANVVIANVPISSMTNYIFHFSGVSLVQTQAGSFEPSTVRIISTNARIISAVGVSINEVTMDAAAITLDIAAEMTQNIAIRTIISDSMTQTFDQRLLMGPLVSNGPPLQMAILSDSVQYTGPRLFSIIAQTVELRIDANVMATGNMLISNLVGETNCNGMININSATVDVFPNTMVSGTVMGTGSSFITFYGILRFSGMSIQDVTIGDSPDADNMVANILSFDTPTMTDIDLIWQSTLALRIEQVDRVNNVVLRNVDTAMQLIFSSITANIAVLTLRSTTHTLNLAQGAIVTIGNVLPMGATDFTVSLADTSQLTLSNMNMEPILFTISVDNTANMLTINNGFLIANSMDALTDLSMMPIQVNTGSIIGFAKESRIMSLSVSTGGALGFTVTVLEPTPLVSGRLEALGEINFAAGSTIFVEVIVAAPMAQQRLPVLTANVLNGMPSLDTTYSDSDICLIQMGNTIELVIEPVGASPSACPMTEPPMTTEPPTTEPPMATEPPTTAPPMTTEPPTTDMPTTQPPTGGNCQSRIRQGMKRFIDIAEIDLITRQKLQNITIERIKLMSR
eukprot:CAMPEP_0168531016 /NCGR_PEP_ID=MMETSP0405-20121227/15109_1 /TAXON_ID=498012 /ORGANISM="Trichosphaerium sp, Strain Am-I-7 wt" /LENGTH=629 /DNA_ID=CAMNT_0008555563 /DNA_START=36 /DNA_END=1925 /DNA_ORIENTATION=+